VISFNKGILELSLVIKEPERQSSVGPKAFHSSFDDD